MKSLHSLMYFLWKLKYRLHEITTGWYGLLFKEITPTISDRLKICNNCTYKSKINFCKACGCFIPAKCFSQESSCIKDKW